MTKIWKSIVASSLVTVLMLGSTPVHTFAQAEQTNYSHSFGCIMETPEMLLSVPQAASRDRYATLPSVVDLSYNMPQPGNQANENSCTAWAVAYAYKSYQEKVEHKWDVNDLGHKFSPAYVYNQANGGSDEGISIPSAMNLIVNQGVCSLKDMPYTAGDYLRQPTAYQKQQAAKYKALSYKYIAAGDVDTMKAHLAAGDALVVGVPVYSDFDDLSSSNSIYDNANGTLEGYHAICIVGYDNSKSAFKFINSWGTGYGLGGYGYMSYNLIRQFQTYSYFMTDVIDQTNVTIKASANGKFVCTDNNKKGIVVGDRSSADTWEKYEKINNSDGTISLLSLANNKYVCADLNENSKLIARSSSIDSWEKFKVVDMGNGKVALQSLANNKYVSCDLNKDGVLYANRDKADTWEMFTLTNVQ